MWAKEAIADVPDHPSRLHVSTIIELTDGILNAYRPIMTKLGPYLPALLSSRRWCSTLRKVNDCQDRQHCNEDEFLVDAIKKQKKTQSTVAWLAFHSMGAVVTCVGVAGCLKCPHLLTPSSGLSVFKRFCRKCILRARV